MSRSTLRIAAVAVLGILLLAGGIAAFVWFKIAGLKAQVAGSLEKALGAKVGIASLSVDAWNQRIEATDISLVNQRPEAPWDKGEIGQAVAKFHWRDLFGSTIPLSVEVSSWTLVLHSLPTTGASSMAPSVTTGGDSLPSKDSIQVTQLSAHDGEVEVDLTADKKVLIHQVGFEADDNGTGVWTTELKAGSIDAGTIQAGAGSVQIRGDKEKIGFSHLHIQSDQGALEGSGEISLMADHATQASLTATRVPVALLVATAWQTKISGLASGNVDYQGTDQGASAHGHLDVAQGRLNVLPFLSQVTALVRLPDLTNVDLDKATADFDWKDHVLRLTNLDLRKTDVARISGDVQINPTGQVDGRLKLGLPSAVTSKWPNLQDKVFSVAFEDYNWTDVHVTGMPDHLNEDLTPRLLAAGVDSGGSLLNSTTQKAVDLFNSVLGK